MLRTTDKYVARPFVANSMMSKEFSSLKDAVNYLFEFTQTELSAEEYQAIGKLTGPNIPRLNENGGVGEAKKRKFNKSKQVKNKNIQKSVSVVDMISHSENVESDPSIQPVKRGRGRPKGSKNKNASNVAKQVKSSVPVGTILPDGTIKRGRGRPKGSTNKPKQ